MFPLAVFVDWHGVLCSQPFWHHLPEEHACHGYAQALFAQQGLCERWMRGELSTAGALEHVVPEQEIPDEVFRELAISIDQMTCDPDLVAELQRLRPRVEHMAIATDNIDAAHRARWPTEIFDAFLCSTDVGALKADDPEAFFSRHLRLAGIEKSHALLIDDRADNCAAFRAWGGQAVCFTDVPQLAVALAELQ